MAKFKLFWENNPDTPLSSERLSSSLDYYSLEPILYFDSEDKITGHYDYLKIRDNFKSSIKIPTTILGLDFNYSLICYNSNFTPKDADNIVFRDDHRNNFGSAAFDESIDNIITNSGFEEDLLGWETEVEGNSNITIDTNNYYPANLSAPKSALMTIDSFGNIPRLKRTITTPYTGNLSLSFYYKTDSLMYVQVLTRKNNTPNYWNGNNWVLSNTYFTLTDTEGEWKRFEMERIDVNLVDFIEIRVYSDQANSTHNIDSFLLERKDFCSSYYPGTLGSSFLSYDRNVINIPEGTLDMVIHPKYEDDITFFVLKATSGEDVFKFRFDSSYDRFELIFFDEFINNYTQVNIPFSYGSLINDWKRILLSWSLEQQIININIDGYYRQINIPDNLIVKDYETYGRFYIGSNENNEEIFKGMIEFLKIDNKFQTKDEMDDDLIYPPTIKENDYKIFQNANKSLLVDEKLLDKGSVLESDRSYFLWVADNNNGEDCEVLLSKNPNYPEGYKWYNSRVFGGFRTDNNGDIIRNSIWDLSTHTTHNLHIDRLLIGNTRTLNIDDVTTETPTPVEIRTTPWGDDNDATFNIDSTFTRHIYGRNVTDGNFLDIDTEEGEAFLDDLHFDGHSINSMDTDLEIFSSGSNTVDVHSNEIKLTSEGDDIKLDNVRVKGSVVYIKDDETLTFNANFDDTNDNNNIDFISNDIINTIGNDYKITAVNEIDFDAGQYVKLNAGNENVEITTERNHIIITSKTDVRITSTDGVIRLDDLRVDGNKLYRDGANQKLLIQSTDNVELSSSSGNVKLEDYNVNNNKIFKADETNTFIQFVEDTEDDTLENIIVSADGSVIVDSPVFHVKSPDIRFNTTATDFITLDLVKIKNNQIYTESGTTLDVMSPENITVDSGSTLKLEGKTVDINSVDGAITLDNISINGNTIETIDNENHNLTIKSDRLFLDTTSGRVDVSDANLYVNNGSGTVYANATSATKFDNEVSLILKTDDTSKVDNYSVTKTLEGTEGTITFNINHTHDGRYYTETEADNRFVNANGDTLNGRLELSHTNGHQNVLRVLRPIDHSESPAAILVATDADPDNDVAFEVRGNASGASVDTTEDTLTSPDMKLQIWGNGNLNTTGEITADKVYNAVWMDLAECWKKDNTYNFQYNQVVVQTENGIKPSERRAEKATVGIISNTYGYLLGSEGFDSKDFENSIVLPVAIAGRVKAKYRGKIEIGDELVSHKNGEVARANIFERIFKRDRLLGRVDSMDDGMCTIKVY